METKSKLLTVLRQAFPDMVDGLFEVPGGQRVTGFIASDRFDELDHAERQDLLWRVVDAGLDKQEQRQIGPIVAMTHEEPALKLVDDD